MSARRIVVSGHVQGVGFRYFARRAARETGVTGWVRNLPDGTVETLAEGEPDALDRYLERLRQGPGRVSAVSAEETVPQRLGSFEITR